MSTVLTCVASAAHSAVAIVDYELLASAQGVQLRRAHEGAADLVFFATGQEGGATAAFIYLHEPTPAALLRVSKAGKTFKRTFVLMPNRALQEPPYQEAAYRLGVAESLSFVVMPMGSSFTQEALQLAQAVISGVAQELAWRREQTERVESSQAVVRVLTALPLPQAEQPEAQHLAHMLRMLGSIAHISCCNASEIAAPTGLSPAAAGALAAFFSDAGLQARSSGDG